MAKSKSITIELIEKDPNNNDDYYPCNSKNFDADGKCTRVEMRVESGTVDTNGYQTTIEFRKGHITDSEATKLVKNLINGSSTKNKLLFKSLNAFQSKDS